MSPAETLEGRCRAAAVAARKAPEGYDVERLDHRRARRRVAQFAARLDRMIQGRPVGNRSTEEKKRRLDWGHAVRRMEADLAWAVALEAEIISRPGRQPSPVPDSGAAAAAPR